MPKARFIHDGKTTDYTPLTDVAAGDVITEGSFLGIAKLDIPANQLGALALEGVFRVPKDISMDLFFGNKVYWSAANQWATAMASGNVMMGVSLENSESGDSSTVLVRLSRA